MKITKFIKINVFNTGLFLVFLALLTNPVNAYPNGSHNTSHYEPSSGVAAIEAAFYHAVGDKVVADANMYINAVSKITWELDQNMFWLTYCYYADASLDFGIEFYCYPGEKSLREHKYRATVGEEYEFAGLMAAFTSVTVVVGYVTYSYAMSQLYTSGTLTPPSSGYYPGSQSGTPGSGGSGSGGGGTRCLDPETLVEVDC